MVTQLLYNVSETGYSIKAVYMHGVHAAPERYRVARHDMKLKVPFFKQDKEYTCGPAAMQMALAFLGSFHSEHGLSKALHTNAEIGTRHSAIIDEARSEGFFCYVNNNSSLEEVESYIERKLPVIVHFIEPSSNEGHYAVVLGFTGTQIILHDPWNGPDFKIDKNDFSSRWHGTQNHHEFHRWMMVICRDHLELGKQYSPLKKP
jgi:predicted double-glycine peptidase